MRASPSGTPVAVTRAGTGPEVLLVHGGASPATTWSGLESLSARWTLAFVHRRGYPPSPPPPGGRQDFQLDAADVCELLGDRPHLVGHSYGGVAAALAATIRPDAVRSLTLLEPALFLPAGDPEVERFRRIGDEVLARGMDTNPEILRTFLKISGAPVPDGGPLPAEVVRGVRRAHGGRPPSEARPPWKRCARPGSRRSSPLATITRRSSGCATRPRPRSAPVVSSPRAPGTSWPERPASPSSSISFSCLWAEAG